MTYEEVVDRLRVERLSRRWSQLDVGERVGKSRAQVGAWERGYSEASPDDLAAWARVLGYQLDLQLHPLRLARAEAPAAAAGMAEEPR